MMFQAMVALAAVTPTECSRRAEFAGPSPEVAVVLARSMGQTESVGTEAAGLVGATVSLPSVEAHRFVVLGVQGGTDLLDQGETFLAVPWAYRGDCTREPFQEVSLFSHKRCDNNLLMFHNCLTTLCNAI